MSVKKHRHKFSVACWCGTKVTFLCRCGEVRQREMDREELRRHRGESGFAPTPKDNIHRVVHDFYRRFKKDEKWRFEGYDFAQRARRWAGKRPGDVRLVSVDDGSFCGSLLVLIECRAANAYMGTAVVYIPQCTGEPPTEFFLYPSHREVLGKALREIAQEAAPRDRRERAVEAQRAKWWASRKP